MIDQAFSAGAAIELLLKATLATVDIHLIRESGSNHIAALSLSGKHTKPAVPPLPDIRTLAPPGAVTILELLANQKFSGSSDLKTVLAVRDSAVHMGFVDARANERAVGGLVKLVGWVLAVRRGLGQDGDWDTFWSKHAQQAREILDARNEEIFTEFQRKISAAKARYAKLAGTESGRDAIPYLEEGEEPLAVNEISRETVCPACGCRGRTRFEVVLRPLVVDSEFPPGQPANYGQVIGRPDQFHCSVCKLALVGDDLTAAGIVEEVALSAEEMSRDGFFDWLLMNSIDEQP
ncbi:hypothetical protein [Nocardia sp. NPDC050412]|uniref:hypothetical protein n=1 Tax=Nocardia sp. NPDC050412 TaxID=3364320 RepID=UPI0037A33CE1